MDRLGSLMDRLGALMERLGSLMDPGASGLLGRPEKVDSVKEGGLCSDHSFLGPHLTRYVDMGPQIGTGVL